MTGLPGQESDNRTAISTKEHDKTARRGHAKTAQEARTARQDAQEKEARIGLAKRGEDNQNTTIMRERQPGYGKQDGAAQYSRTARRG
jgi:hypothetical protein